jgi:Holliday junction resolvase
MPVRNNRWIRLPKDKWTSADAQSLASLFRDNGWPPSSIDGNSAAVGLLKAIGVSLSDLKLEFITENSEQRNELVNTMTELHQAIGGDLSQIRTVVRHMQDNEDLSQNLEKLLETTEGDLSQVLEYAEERQNRQRRGYENQRLGSKVEKLVKAILEKEGFSVERTGSGSDFEISEDTDDITTLDIVQDDQSWLIEVKSTQTENDHQSVRMSSKQAQTAVEKKGEFLLCIVPIGSENTEPDLETVRGNMRFIKNIHEKLGSRVATLCESIEEQEEVLANTPDDTSSGVDLDFKAGKAGIRVAKFVWEDEGFQLENLAEQLKQVKTT